MDLGIKDKKAIVCAASKGLGKGCAVALAREGVELVITARGREALAATAEEIQRATAGLELNFVNGLESNLGRSMRLADGLGYDNDAGSFQTEYQKMLAVTQADVKRVANKYLTKGRVVLSVVPLGKTAMASKPSENTPYRRTEQ